ncbi:MAG: hypothetical protein ISP90_02910 [Nevskia sp.]|nr:hypothetical protein [Nevskia sp.]
MNVTDAEDFKKALAECFAGYSRQLREDTLAAFWRALKHQPLQRIRDALLAYSRNGRDDSPPSPAAIVKILKAFAEERIETGAPVQCSFEAGGKRCPLRGTHRIGGTDDTPKRFCLDHHGLRNDPQASAQFLEIANRRELPYNPPRSLVLVAARMGQADVERDPQMGPKMIHYLSRNKLADLFPAWVQSTPGVAFDPRSVGVVLKRSAVCVPSVAVPFAATGPDEYSEWAASEVGQ